MKKYKVRIAKVIRMCLATHIAYALPPNIPQKSGDGPPENVSKNDRIYQETRVITSRDFPGGYYDNAPPPKFTHEKKYDQKRRKP